MFLGKTYESDTFLMGTATGVHLARTVRRLPEGEQADGNLAVTLQGTPWDRKIGQIGRPKKAAGPAVVAPPTVDAKDLDNKGSKDEQDEPDKPEQKDTTVDRGLADGSGKIYAKDEGLRRGLFKTTSPTRPARRPARRRRPRSARQRKIEPRHRRRWSSRRK